MRQKVEPEKVIKVFIPVFFSVVFLDQGTKIVSILLNFSTKKSQALAFGFLSPDLAYLTLLFLFLIFLFFPKEKDSDYFSFGLFLGGGAANLIDRVRLGYVLDNLPFFSLFWFNLADFSIFLSICILAIRVFFKRKV
ncbi:hypothetical protein A2Z23_02275 [Candidatus Curtissbacteria bacterium RBG_16_39_7]|uniref:Uncharacterized protein n=1 Tax=Candidatus Curtissbacteria bacterium RBG_16_39_7 TaxID=1797707 RepID=A0A1F5G2X0_9BACT|nr:MAG: hypothetical protein A2Z23_02275 [Candidatus Curtissbacteria bacterium RBG_16_39_7]